MIDFGDLGAIMRLKSLKNPKLNSNRPTRIGASGSSIPISINGF